MTKPVTYSDSGVDIDAANRATAKIKDLAKQTFNQRTLSEIGSFGGMFDGAFPNMTQPVLVASADGVGTKLNISFLTGVHNPIGRDLVNHCVNDILVQGARPLFFLDYIATGKLSPEVVADIVAGITNGCSENGCVLLGGETAEMPGFYADGEYDVAGFIVGVVDREKVIDGKSIAAGDVVLALPSVGLHTNGYSLARKLFLEIAGYEVDTHLEVLGMTVGEALLQPHLSYLRPRNELLDSGIIKGLAHITGGGLTDNIPRILPANCDAVIETKSWRAPRIFQVLEENGKIDPQEMYQVFNMGIGMVVVVSERDAERAMLMLKAKRIGQIVSGNARVRLKF